MDISGLYYRPGKRTFKGESDTLPGDNGPHRDDPIDTQLGLGITGIDVCIGVCNLLPVLTVMEEAGVGSVNRGGLGADEGKEACRESNENAHPVKNALKRTSTVKTGRTKGKRCRAIGGYTNAHRVYMDAETRCDAASLRCVLEWWAVLHSKPDPAHRVHWLLYRTRCRGVWEERSRSLSFEAFLHKLSVVRALSTTMKGASTSAASGQMRVERV